MTSNNNTKTSKHRCRVFIKKKFLNELIQNDRLKYVKYILVNNFWCSVNKNHQVSNNMHPPFMNSTFIFLGIYIYFNYHPMFGNSKNSSLPNTTQPLTVSKTLEESAKKKFHLGCQVSKGTNIFFKIRSCTFFDILSHLYTATSYFLGE